MPSVASPRIMSGRKLTGSDGFDSIIVPSNSRTLDSNSDAVCAHHYRRRRKNGWSSGLCVVVLFLGGLWVVVLLLGGLWSVVSGAHTEKNRTTVHLIPFQR